MDIKDLRTKTGLSQREFGERLGLTSQSITKYEAGASVSSSVKKLIRYEFAKYMPENERLFADPLPGKSSKKTNNRDYEACKEKLEQFKKLIEELKNDKEQLFSLLKCISGKTA